MCKMTVFLGLAFLLSGGVAGATGVTVVHGAGALATFHQTSADGCVQINGELAVLQATQGSELANGLYVTGTRQDTCDPNDNGAGYAGFAVGSFQVVTLALGHFSGTAVVESYSGGPPLSLALDLWWVGTGKITRSHNVFNDGSAINFDFSATRNATTWGTFTVGGTNATVDSATLISDTNGQIVR